MGNAELKIEIGRLGRAGGSGARFEIVSIGGANSVSVYCRDDSDLRTKGVYFETSVKELEMLLKKAKDAESRLARLQANVFKKGSNDVEAKEIFDRAEAYLENDRKGRAIDDLRTLVKRYPDNAWAELARKKLVELDADVY